ncbi:MAG: hypothetical protein LUH23_09420 [Oscillospiraceae bacterium]|nr:hypothetical protein [Oscillospiraceae bacterium]
MNILILGGDARQIYCAGRLALEPGVSVRRVALGTDAFSGETAPCDVLLLPYKPEQGSAIVGSADANGEEVNLSDALNLVKDGGAVFAGKMDDETVKSLEARKIAVHNWFSDEALTLANAKFTAEGASQIITKNAPGGVSGSKILILGWGRVAKACAELFGKMGARVLVAARRRETLTDCIYNYAGFIDPAKISEADVIVNTIPARVFSEEELKHVKRGAFLLELASAPYGIDFDKARELGIPAILASGVPGKYTPEEAGRALAEAVLRHLKVGEAP